MSADILPGTVRVDGLNRLIRTLRDAGDDLSDMAAAHARVAGIVAARARITAPRRSGRLAASVRAGTVKGRARVMAGRASVPYALPIHWGWPGRPQPAWGIRGGPIAEDPWVSAAAQDTEDLWRPQYERELQRIVDTVRGV